MEKFWNKFHILLGALAIIVPILIFVFSFSLKDYGQIIVGAIALFTAFISILTTLYSNYNNNLNIKKQLILNKKQEIYLELYSKLDENWDLLNKNKIEYFIKNSDYEVLSEFDANTFLNIYDTIFSFRVSSNFYYLSIEMQIIIDDFIKYSGDYINFDYLRIGQFDERNCMKAFEILSYINPLLEAELGVEL